MKRRLGRREGGWEVSRAGFERGGGTRGKSNSQLGTTKTSRGGHAVSKDSYVGALEAVAGVVREEGRDLRREEREGGKPHDDEEDVQREDGPVVEQVGDAELGDKVVDANDESEEALVLVAVQSVTKRTGSWMDGARTYNYHDEDVSVKGND